MATMRPTPRNELLGLLSDAMAGGLEYMRDPQRTQQMQGLAGLLESTGIPKTTERLAYGEPLTNIGRANVPLLKPETADALMTVAPFAPKGMKMIRATEGMPVGMSIKDVGKNIFEDATKYHQKVPEIKSINVDKLKRMNAGEVADVSDEVAAKMDFSKPIQVSVFADGELRIVDGHHRVAAAKKLGIKSLPVELQAINAKGSTLNKLAQEATYPQQAALDIAQQRAALPIEQGGLGLPANNTAADRAKAMGFETPALHGSGTPDINAFDPNLVGTKAGNAFDNYMWFTSNPESASGYALNTNQFALIPDVKALNNQINQIGKDISSAYTNKNMDKVGDLRKELSVLMKQKSDIYKDFEMGKYISEGSTTYPVFLKSNEFMPYEANNQNWMKANRPAIEESQSRGFQGVEIKNVKDNPNPSIGNVISNTYATENPDLIRSRFAAFDPFRKDVATATAMGVALPDLLAAELPEEELKRNQSAGLLFP